MSVLHLFKLETTTLNNLLFQTIEKKEEKSFHIQLNYLFVYFYFFFLTFSQNEHLSCKYWEMTIDESHVKMF